MGFNEFLSSIFGNKSTRDMKEIKPWVEKIKAAYPEIEKLDNGAKAGLQGIYYQLRRLIPTKTLPIITPCTGSPKNSPVNVETTIGRPT